MNPWSESEGIWWCLQCHRVTEPADPGEPYQACAHCRSRRIEYRPANATAAPQPKQQLERTPLAGGWNLAELAERGYWFCRTCRRISGDKSADGRCLRCGSRQLQWQAPVFAEETA